MDGKEKRIPNTKETVKARAKQDALRQAFKDWIFDDPARRERLVGYYNEHFNTTRPREFDGSHLTFPGINPEITLRKHQRDAVARVLYGGNALLAHCVGAGKTWTMAAAAMELRRLGLSHKPMFVVPNSLTEQWGAEFQQLYPGANILVATEADFAKANRKAFCARIATGDYDAVIIGHTQFEKIPLSPENERKHIEKQIDTLELSITEAKRTKDLNFTVRQLESSKKKLETRLKTLMDAKVKDDVITFEELGVDHLFVDEADEFKNLALYTKMRNVGGISNSAAQKSEDMLAKCEYLNEKTGYRGICFATGTPVSNSMTELYTMMRYLQADTLENIAMSDFDSWASNFGETVTAMELAPEGTGYRTKTRFAKFCNLPELISLWRQAADIQTADMLHLPRPEAEYHNVKAQPTPEQQAMVQSLGKRADHVRSGAVAPYEDNIVIAFVAGCIHEECPGRHVVCADENLAVFAFSSHKGGACRRHGKHHVLLAIYFLFCECTAGYNAAANVNRAGFLRCRRVFGVAGCVVDGCTDPRCVAFAVRPPHIVELIAVPQHFNSGIQGKRF